MCLSAPEMTVALVTFVDCGGNRPIDLLPLESEVLSFREINQANEENPLGYSGAGRLYASEAFRGKPFN